MRWKSHRSVREGPAIFYKEQPAQFLVFERSGPHNSRVRKYLQDIYDIRVKPDAPRTPKRHRPCEWKGCTEGAPHRAPKSRERLNEYHWFCLDHVRQYNARWNFFEGMSQEEVERYIHNNAAGQRPTWKVGSGDGSGTEGPQPWRAFRHDPFGVFDDGPDPSGGRTQRAAPWAPKVPAETQRALAALDLDETATLEEIKTRYKELVKRYHPDANGGDRNTEERLRRVIQAYTHLKSRNR